MRDNYDWESNFQECSYSNKLIKKIIYLNNNSNNKVDVQEVKKAIYYAKKYHGEQKRESGEPYYSHPLEVAFMVADYLFDTEALIVAILHDVIEDTELNMELISNIFSKEIASQVNDLTRVKIDGVKTSSEDTLKKLWKEEKYRLLLIKQFDRVHNMQTLSAKSYEKAQRIAVDTVKNFILLSAYLEMPEAESKLIELCHEVLKLY